MAIDFQHFIRLKAGKQVKYLEKGEFVGLSRKKKIEFLKTILNEDLPAAITACALRLLNELNYPDRYYFKKFIYHPDNTVANIAKEAVREWRESGSSGTRALVDMLLNGKSADRILLLNYFLEEKGKLNEHTLISFLCTGDQRVCEVIVNKITPEYRLDDAKLSKAITKGTTWYVRAALVEILGNRKSEHLFDCIDFLMNDRNVEVKLKLINALAKLEMEKGKPYLQKLTGDPAVWVRKKAQRALQAM
jgi:HEAT repeat protein